MGTKAGKKEVLTWSGALLVLAVVMFVLFCLITRREDPAARQPKLPSGPSRESLMEKGSGAYLTAAKQEEAELRTRKEMEQEEAQRIANEEAQLKAKREVERNAQEEADRKGREEAERIAKKENERRAKEEAERKAKEEA